jgi:hypothetical protein
MPYEKETEKEKEEGARNFEPFLRAVNGGSFTIELAEELYKLNDILAKHASQVGKAKGELHIAFKFDHHGEGQVDVNTELKVKTPKTKRARSVFWLTLGGNLSDSPPQQEKLFRDVNKQKPARDVTPEAPRAARSV